VQAGDWFCRACVFAQKQESYTKKRNARLGVHEATEQSKGHQFTCEMCSQGGGIMYPFEKSIKEGKKKYHAKNTPKWFVPFKNSTQLIAGGFFPQEPRELRSFYTRNYCCA
jgi:hypothetical protein